MIIQKKKEENCYEVPKAAFSVDNSIQGNQNGHIYIYIPFFADQK